MEGWKTDKLMNLVSSITTGKLDANAMVPNGQYRFYTCAKEYYFIDKYAFDDEALLISGNGEYVGYIHYYKGKFNAYQRVYVITGFKIDVKYLQSYLNRYLSIRINKEVSQNNIPYIRLSTLSKMDIRYPESLSEQTAIANILSKVDDAIASVQSSIAAAERLKKSLMQNLLTGRMKLDGTIRKDDEFYMDEKFGKVPMGWEVEKFGKRVIVLYGKSQKEVVSENGTIPVYGTGGIIEYATQALCNHESILVGRKGTIDKPFYIDKPFWAVDTTYYVDRFIDGNMRYLYYMLLRMNLGNLNEATGVPSVTRRTLNRQRLIIPPIDEQNDIVNVIDKVEKQIINKQSRIATLERLKKSLMQNLLTGKVRIKNK